MLSRGFTSSGSYPNSAKENWKCLHFFHRIVAEIWRPHPKSKPDTSGQSFWSTRLKKSGHGEKNLELENLGRGRSCQVRFRAIFQSPESSDSVGTGNAVDDPDVGVGSGRPDPSSVDGNLRPVKMAKGVEVFLRVVRLPIVRRRRRHRRRHLRFEAEQNHQWVEHHQVRMSSDVS